LLIKSGETKEEQMKTSLASFYVVERKSKWGVGNNNESINTLPEAPRTLKYSSKFPIILLIRVIKEVSNKVMMQR